MKIGIFGGCFNPPHRMHYDIAKNLLKQGLVDYVWYVPTGSHYEKKDLISGESRYQMLKLMVEGDMHIGVSDYELKHSSPTFATLDYFQAKYPEDVIYFICGTDNLKEFLGWDQYQYILTNYKVIVVKREQADFDELVALYFPYRENILLADIPTDILSSSAIREVFRCAENPFQQLRASGWVSPSVLDYIEENKLYRKGSLTGKNM